MTFERVPIPHSFHSYLKLQLEHIEQTTGAYVKLPPTSVTKDEVIVAGDVNKVKEAVVLVKSMYEDYQLTSSSAANMVSFFPNERIDSKIGLTEFHFHPVLLVPLLLGRSCSLLYQYVCVRLYVGSFGG